jgi:hypothetical protein
MKVSSFIFARWPRGLLLSSSYQPKIKKSVTPVTDSENDNQIFEKVILYENNNISPCHRREKTRAARKKTKRRYQLF